MAAACGLVAGGIALARGLDMNMPSFSGARGSISVYSPAYTPSFDDGPIAPDPTPKHSSRGPASFGYGTPVCVRLCDGAFFPTASVSGGESACASQCPDAPTALYTMSSDRIEDAVSSDGERYTRLPVAKRYQTHFDSTCTCHRGTVAMGAERRILEDTTLRKGDVVMTRGGFRVYEGDGYGPSGSADFVALSKARLPKTERADLAAMERASAGSPRIAAPAQVVARPRGNVTVENSAPAPVR
jgi:hypothetical protein